MADVFISHDMEQDGEVVRRICNDIENQGISCWIAPRNQCDDVFQNEVYPAIQDAKLFLLVLTKRTEISDHIRTEVTEALKCRQSYKKEEKAYHIKTFLLDGKKPDHNEIKAIADYPRIDGGTSEKPDTNTLIKSIKRTIIKNSLSPEEHIDGTGESGGKTGESGGRTGESGDETGESGGRTDGSSHKIFPGKLLKVILTALHNASPFFVVFLCLFALYSFIKHGTTIPVGPEYEDEVKYEEAAMLSRSRNRADRLQAAIIWGGLGKYKDSRERSMEIWAEYREPAVISAGFTHTVALTDNGDVMTAVVEKEEENELRNVVTWHNMIEISAGNGFTVGLRDDYKTIAVGRNNNGQCRVNSGWYEKGDWSNIVSISANDSWTVALREDGRALVTGNGKDSRCFEEDDFWNNDIVAVSAGLNHIVGLRLNGTVVTEGNKYGNTYGQREVQDWDNIIAVGAGADYTVGLRVNGEVVVAGGNGRFDGVNDWRNIEAISAGYYHIIGLTKGQAIGVGDNSDGQIDVSGSDWQRLVAVSAGWRHTVGLRDDGTVVSTGHSVEGQRNLDEWNGNVRIR